LEYLTGKKCMIMLNCSFNSEPWTQRKYEFCGYIYQSWQ
jgi:hypothetical protein